MPAAASWSAVDHYENFPVASRLLPARLRPAVVAIYRFARHADDLADEGDLDAAARLSGLQTLRTAIESATPLVDEPAVVSALRPVIGRHQLPIPLFLDLLSAFEQDARGFRHRSRDDLLDYCRRSANPVGRLMLALFEVPDEAAALACSDSICTGLQLANFLQDLAIDLARGRVYLPEDRLAARGLVAADLHRAVVTGEAPEPLRRVIEAQARWAESLLREGSALSARVGWRFSLELRLIVAGGLRILEQLKRSGYDPIARRPRLRGHDALALLRLMFRQRP
jgi:squalene synthase HpnC